MKRIWILAAGFIMGAPLRSNADVVKVDAAPKVEESTHDTDKAAVHDASTEADQWAAKNAKKEVPVAAPPPVQEAAPPVQAEAPKPAKVEPPKATAPAPAPRTGLNEMKGKLESKSFDPKSLRLTVEGGYNVEFTYDAHTTIVNGGSPITIDDLSYGDQLIVRYAGKDLNALEIDRVSKAPRPQ